MIKIRKRLLKINRNFNNCIGLKDKINHIYCLSKIYELYI